MPTNAINEDLLSVYLHDHLAGAGGGVELAKRAAKERQGSAAGDTLARIAAELEEDRDALRAVAHDLGIREHSPLEGATWLLEKVARLKPNGQLTGHSPLSPLIELEAMRLGLEGKRAGWTTLRQLADVDDRLDPEQLDRLIARSAEQADAVEALRQNAIGLAFLIDAPAS